MASRRYLYFVMILLLILVLTGCGQVASRLPLIDNLQARNQARASQRQQAQHVTDGNAAYTEGDLDGAEVHYQDALDLNANLAVALHNQGNIDYRNGLWEDAEVHYENALEHHQPGSDVNPWAVSHYNLGNINYHTSQQAEADPTSLTDAVEHYKDALRQDPTDEDAKYNLELALRQQADQPPPEEQPQDSDEQQDDQQDQDEQQTPPEDGEPEEDESQESPPQDSDPQDGDEPQEDGNEQPSESQEGDEQEEDAGEGDAEPQDGEEADAEPEDADGDSDSSPEDDGEPQDGPAGAQQPIVMTPAQAAQLLEAAVGQSETLQAYLQQATSPLPPPEQDW